MDRTSASLLERLRQPGQPDAWARFVKLYTPLLLYWSRRLGLQAHDADDFVQEVLTAVLQKLPAFVYDPGKRFRSWLRTVAHNKWYDRQRRRAALPTAGEADLAQLVGPNEVDALAEDDERKYLVLRALELVRDKFKPMTWKACWMFVVEDRPAAEVGAELNMTANAVHIAVTRVLAYLRQEMAELLD